jgi:hypothetical protein
MNVAKSPSFKLLEAAPVVDSYRREAIEKCDVGTVVPQAAADRK